MVVMKNLKRSLKLRVLSPKVMDKLEPDFTTYYNRIGSNEGSKSFATFSIITHFPNYIASSRVRIKLLSFILSISIPSSCSLPRFFMNLLAYVYGSIINGYLLLLSIIIPFSIDVSSFGNPAIFQDYILTGSPINYVIL